MGRGGVWEGERGELKGSRRERRKGSGWEGGERGGERRKGSVGGEEGRRLVKVSLCGTLVWLAW